jgi:hypothetical protein
MESICFHEAEITEVALLLPSNQVAALERVAHRQGLTVGQFIRRLIGDSLAAAPGQERTGSRIRPLRPNVVLAQVQHLHPLFP